MLINKKEIFKRYPREMNVVDMDNDCTEHAKNVFVFEFPEKDLKLKDKGH